MMIRRSLFAPVAYKIKTDFLIKNPLHIQYLVVQSSPRHNSGRGLISLLLNRPYRQRGTDLTLQRMGELNGERIKFNGKSTAG